MFEGWKTIQNMLGFAGLQLHNIIPDSTVSAHVYMGAFVYPGYESILCIWTLCMCVNN